MKLNKIAILILAIPLALSSQEFRGTISGAVTDASGAVIAGAKVSVTETHTNTKIEAVSESTGQYTAPFLLPGDYDVTAKLAGFKEYVRKGIHVGAGEHPIIDIRMEVGEITQAVEVTAEAPLVDKEASSVGHAITTKEVEDLPLNGGSPWMLSQLEIGVIYSPFNSNSSVQQTYDSSNAFSIAGTPTQSSEMLLNGAPNATWDMRSAYTPPKDAVQEVRTTVLNTDAGFGHTRGGTINMVMKSGTNELHGSMWENMQPSNLTANSFFNNAKGLGNPLTHYNQYGLTAGGPVLIPKIFNGKDKLFWFFAWQNDKNTQPFTSFISVPTDAEKRGDFSQILQTDGTQLYDPFSATASGSSITRQPLPGNIIPTNRINPIAQQYLKFFPEPNVAGVNATTRPDGYFNYGTTAPNTNTADNESGQLDYNMSYRSRLSANIRHNSLAAKKNDYFQNIASGQITARENWGGSLDEVYSINSNNILNLRLNFTYMYESSTDSSQGFDPTSIGFPGYIGANTVRPSLPYVYFDTSTAFQALGYNQAASRPSQSFQLYGSWTRIKGNHTFRAGGDLRQQRLSTITYGYGSGGYNFGGNRWVNRTASASETEAMGQDMAQLLYGLPTQGFFDINTYGSWYSYYGSGFVQDDWRVSKTLTVNLGLRYEHDGPYHETYGRTVNGFDTTSTNPLAAAAQAAYAKSPISQLPVSAFQVLGGLTFAGAGNNTVFANSSHLFSPRASLAWSPEALHGKTVIRVGFGMFVAPIAISYVGPDGKYSTSPRTPLGQEGFSQSTPVTATNDNYLTPAMTLSNPFPNGFLASAGSSLGLLTYAGQTLQFMNPDMQNGYSERWNFDIQHTLSTNTMFEIAYIGNHALHLPVNVTQLNGLPRADLSTLPVKDANTTYLTNSVTNPFSKLQTSQNGSTAALAQLLAPYPEFPVGDSATGWNGGGGILEYNATVGSSYFHSFNARLQKRTSHGLTLNANFIYSKLIERLSWLNASDAVPERRVSPTDRPLRFVTSLVYELPIGQNKWINLQSRWANTLLGGWRLTSIYSWQVGGPVVWNNGSSTSPGDYVYFGGPLNLNPRQTNGTAFDTTQFVTNSTNAFQYHLRTFSTTFGNLRTDGINALDSSVIKQFRFSEAKRYLELRGEMFNVANHPSFAAPNTTATNSAFGTITSTVNRFRTIQLSARIVF